ncbi:MAG: OmpA family protein [Paraglaciecola sp.]|nr:OmpA family protein [Paraglaciecola sp.]
MDIDSRHDEQIFDETGTWLSISDLMAGLLMVFALLLIVALAQLSELQEQSKSNRIIIIEQIQKGLTAVGIASHLDEKGTLSLVDGLQFEHGSAEINAQGLEFLRKLIPVYSQAIFQNTDTAAEVNYLIIEGHADHNESEKNAMSLSVRRAEAVTKVLQDMPFHYKARFMNKILPAARGDFDANKALAPEKNRKVLFRFEFKSYDPAEYLNKSDNK